MARLVLGVGVLVALVLSSVSPATVLSELRTAPPALRLVRAQPLTVAGTGFKPRERVWVTVVREDQTVRRVVQGSGAGRFVVTFPRLERRRCAAMLVRAFGGRGSRAVLKVAQPACTPG